MRAVSVFRLWLAIGLCFLPLGAALATWETPYGEWERSNIAFKSGYLSGFLQGNLMNTYDGDSDDIREHFKACLPFASHASIFDAMKRTVAAQPELASKSVSEVVIRTLFSMCGGPKKK